MTEERNILALAVWTRPLCLFLKDGKSRNFFALLALICANALFTGCSTSNPEEVVVEPFLNYRYASAEEGRQILLSNTAYLNAHTQTDIEWKTRGKAKSIEEFTALSF